MIPDNKMVSDLEKLGVHERKTPVKEFPYVPEEFIADFIRGCFDGDGCNTINRTPDRYPLLNSKITAGSKKFLDKMSSILQDYDIKSKVYPAKSGNKFTLFMPLYPSLKFCEFIYDGKSDIRLERKFKKYIDYKNFRETNPPKMFHEGGPFKKGHKTWNEGIKPQTRIINCKTCGKEFEATVSEIKRGKKYCCRKCYAFAKSKPRHFKSVDGKFKQSKIL